MNISDNCQDDSYIMEKRLRSYLLPNTKERCKSSKLFSGVEEYLEVPKLRQSIVVRAVHKIFCSTPTPTSKQRNFFQSEASYNISPISSNTSDPKRCETSEQMYIFKDGSLSEKTVVNQTLKNIPKRICTRQISSSLRIQLNNSSRGTTLEIKTSKKNRKSSELVEQSSLESVENRKRVGGNSSSIYKKHKTPLSSITLVNSSSSTSLETDKHDLLSLSNARLKKRNIQSQNELCDYHENTLLIPALSLHESHGDKEITSNVTKPNNYSAVVSNSMRIEALNNSNFHCTTRLSEEHNNISKNVSNSDEILNTKHNTIMTRASLKNKKTTIPQKNLSLPSLRGNLNSNRLKGPVESCKYSHQTFNKKFNVTDYVPSPIEKFNRVMTKLNLINQRKSILKNKTENKNSSFEKTNKENVKIVDCNFNEIPSVLSNSGERTSTTQKSFTEPKRFDETTEKSTNNIENFVSGDNEIMVNDGGNSSKTFSEEPHKSFFAAQKETGTLGDSKRPKRKFEKKTGKCGSVVVDPGNQAGASSKGPCDDKEPQYSQELHGYKYSKPLSLKNKKADNNDDGLVTSCDGQQELRRSSRNRRRPPRRIYGVIVTYSERVFRYYNGTCQDKADELSLFHLVNVENLSAPRKKKNATKRKTSSIAECEGQGFKKKNKRRARK